MRQGEQQVLVEVPGGDQPISLLPARAVVDAIDGARWIDSGRKIARREIYDLVHRDLKEGSRPADSLKREILAVFHGGSGLVPGVALLICPLIDDLLWTFFDRRRVSYRSVVLVSPREAD